jgi:hypothetical protein
VKGEEDRTITAGSLVTVTVILRRRSLVGDTSFADATEHEEVDNTDVEERCEELDEEEQSKQVCPLFSSLRKEAVCAKPTVDLSLLQNVKCCVGIMLCFFFWKLRKVV